MRKTELLKGSTEMIILSLLEEQDMYGYEITERVNKTSDGYFQFKEGTLYPALKRMEVKGLLEGYWKASKEGPKRKYYRLTSFGKKALQIEKDEWSFFQRMINRIVGDSIVNEQ